MRIANTMSGTRPCTARDHFHGGVVKESTLYEVGLRFTPWSSHVSDLEIAIPAATLPGEQQNSFSARTGWSGITKL